MSDRRIDIDGYAGMKIEIMAHFKKMTNGQLIDLMVDTFWTTFTNSLSPEDRDEKLSRMSPENQNTLRKFLKT